MSNMRHDYEQDFSGTFPGSTPFVPDVGVNAPTGKRHPYTTTKQERDYWNLVPVTGERTELTPEEIETGLSNIAKIRAEHGWPQKPSPVLERLEQAALLGQVEPPQPEL